MKKFLVSMIILFVFAVKLPLTAEAQSCRRSYRKSNYNRNYSARNYNYRNVNRRYNSNRNYNRGYYQTRGYAAQRPSFYRRHRNLINVAAGTGAGALLGALIGGRKGALIGTAIGAGGSALYTYKIKPKKRRYYR